MPKRGVRIWRRMRYDARKGLQAAQPIRLTLGVVSAMNPESKTTGWILEVEPQQHSMGARDRLNRQTLLNLSSSHQQSASFTSPGHWAQRRCAAQPGETAVAPSESRRVPAQAGVCHQQDFRWRAVWAERGISAYAGGSDTGLNRIPHTAPGGRVIAVCRNRTLYRSFTGGRLSGTPAGGLVRGGRADWLGPSLFARTVRS